MYVTFTIYMIIIIYHICNIVNITYLSPTVIITTSEMWRQTGHVLPGKTA